LFPRSPVSTVISSSIPPPSFQTSSSLSRIFQQPLPAHTPPPSQKSQHPTQPLRARSAQTAMSGKASGSERQANGSAQHRAHHDGSSSRAYTTEQKATVIRIRRCSPTAFYDILGLEEVKTTCGEGEIKKAYRKLSLLTHPDKNGYDGADEAFKSELARNSHVL